MEAYLVKFWFSSYGPKHCQPIKFMKEYNDEVYFLHADKHRTLLEVDTIILDFCNQACPKHPK